MAQPAAVKWASDDQVEQHSVPATVAYHLLPGVVILVVAIVFVPVAKAAGFPPIVGLLVGMLFGLSVQLGYLLWLGWKRDGRLSLARVVVYRHRLTPQTPFLIGSVTKSFTALAIMQPSFWTPRAGTPRLTGIFLR
jgi:hypothetical protein